MFQCAFIGILCAILDPALKRSEAGLQCLLPLLGRLRVKSMRDLWKGLERTVPFGAFIGTVVRCVLMRVSL